MSVLAAGDASSVGSHTVRALHEANENVVVIDNLSTGFSAHLPEGVLLFIGEAGDQHLVEGATAHDVHGTMHYTSSIPVPEQMRGATRCSAPARTA
jgi:UDP-glucose 4-epimerase